MKNYIILILAFFFIDVLNAQAQNVISDVAIINIPKEAKRITKEQFLANPNGDKRAGFAKNDDVYFRNIYELDGLIISIYDQKVDPRFKTSLEDQRNDILEMLHVSDRIKINYAKLIAVNNINFFIYEYQLGDELYLRFMSDFNGYKCLFGVIQGKITDEKKARTILNEILKTMHFKS